MVQIFGCEMNMDFKITNQFDIALETKIKYFRRYSISASGFRRRIIYNYYIMKNKINGNLTYKRKNVK